MKKILLLTLILLIPLQLVFSEKRFFLGGDATVFTLSVDDKTGYTEKITTDNKTTKESNAYSYSISQLALKLGINFDKVFDAYINIGVGSINKDNLKLQNDEVTLSRLFLTQDINARYNISISEWFSFYFAGGTGLDIHLFSIMDDGDELKYVYSYPLDIYLTLGSGGSFFVGSKRNHRINFGVKVKIYATDIFGIERKKSKTTFTNGNIKRTVSFGEDLIILTGIDVGYSYMF